MPNDKITKCNGLVSQFNVLSIPQGSLFQADDVVIRRENIIETRRGYASYATLSNAATQLMNYSSRILAHNSSALSYDDGSGTLNDYYGTFTAPTSRKMRFEQANGNLYVTTSSGVWVIGDVNTPRTTTGNTTNGSGSITVSSATGISVGWFVSGTGIATGSQVTVISGTTLTLSKNATATGTGVTLTFRPGYRVAGAPRPLDLTATLSTPAATGFLADSKQCAYRAIISRTDQNSNILLSYPTSRLWISNTTGSTKDVTVTMYLNTDLMANDTILFYRTVSSSYSSGSTDGAGDDFHLVYSTTIAQSDITAGSLSFIDVMTDSLCAKTAQLYASEGQEGIGQANSQPPLCKDIALYKSQYMFYANTQDKHRLFFTLLGVGSLDTKTLILAGTTYTFSKGVTTKGTTTSGNNTLTNMLTTYGIAAGMTVTGTGIPGGTTVSSTTATTVVMSGNASATANNVSLTFGAAQDVGSSPVCQVVSGGTAALDIELTARNFVDTINRTSANSSIYARYISGGNDTPGQLMMEERSVGGSAYTVQAGDSAVSAMFDPPPPVSPITNSRSTSSTSIKKNGLYYSKSQQPEAVPLLNYLPAGPSNKEILRIAALRDSLIIIKEEGVYRLTGDSPTNFTVVLLDGTVSCKAADSVAVLNNLVFMLSNQGVVAISDTGVQVISREIEPNLSPLLALSNLSPYTYGLAYNSDRMYELSTVSFSTDTAPTQTFVYNSFTRSWTKKSYYFTAAVIEESTDKMYFVKPGEVTSKIYRERKDFADTDYSDPESTITIASYSGSNLVFTSNTTPMAGYVISQGGTDLAIYTVINTSGTTYSATMVDTISTTWAAGSATMYPSIPAIVQYNPWYGGDPDYMKQVSQVGILTDSASTNHTAKSMDITFWTDLDNSIDTVSLDFTGDAWGTGPWGTMAWGGIEDTHSYPLYTPKNKQYCRLLNIGMRQKYAKEKMSISGVSFTYHNVSERTSR